MPKGFGVKSMNYLETAMTWVQDNPWVTFAIVIYVVANVVPRPHHGKLDDGWRKGMWQIIDRLCWLTSDRVPGSLKLLLLDSPLVVGEKQGVEKALKPKKAEADEEIEGDEPAVVIGEEDLPEDLPDDSAEEEGKDGDEQ